MKQVWFTSVTTEERDQALANLRASYPGIEAYPVGHTNKNDKHVNPFIIVRYENRVPYGPAHFNESLAFPAFQQEYGLIEGVDVPEWTQ